MLVDVKVISVSFLNNNHHLSTIGYSVLLLPNNDHDHRMKQVISMVLILSLSFQCLAKLGLIAAYQLNREYISQELCENKNKPKMHCQGKCFLKKNLARAERNDKEASGIEKQLDIPLFLTVVSEHIPPNPVIIYTGNTLFIMNYAHTVCSNIFHPPLV